MNQQSVLELEKAIGRDYGNIAGIAVHKNGVKCCERSFNGYNAGHALHIFSCTKSVVSFLVGIAADEGLLDIEQKVLDFFPDYAVPPGEKTLQKVTVKNLLTMTAPYKYETEPYEKFFASPDPVRDALDLLGGEKPIGAFHYAAIGGTQILSGILAAAVGGPVFDFATKRLFSPLELYVPHIVTLRDKEEHMTVMNDKATCGWVVDPQGNPTAGWGLFLRTADMAKLGQLALDRGRWNGRQIVSAAWIDESTREQSRCDEWGGLGYGYLWWMAGEGAYAAMGDGGNVIYVNPAKALVVAVASVFAPEPRDRIALIRERIEPLFDGRAS